LTLLLFDEKPTKGRQMTDDRHTQTFDVIKKKREKKEEEEKKKL